MNNYLNILSNFNLRGNVINISPCGNGRINKTFKVETQNSKGEQYEYVLQSINTNLFVDPAKLMKNIELIVSGFRGIEEAIITSGGINTKEINPKTMESKIVKGLYFAGEIIDVDALTGGFNLQIAYSTGFTAGNLV